MNSTVEYDKERGFTIGTRKSRLALWQSEHVLQAVHTQYPGFRCEVRTFVTEGDRRLDAPLPEIGGKGVFTLELERALHAGEIDLVVHSLKDLPVDETPGLSTFVLTPRADARDVLISAQYPCLDALPNGAWVGTSSLRRSAQLLARRPDLRLAPLRGNVETRIRKAMEGEYTAIVLAAAGVERLGLQAQVSEYLDYDVMLPAPGQGALAVQCRASDGRLSGLLAALEHVPTRLAVTAERAFLKALGGGCAAPVAAYAQADGEQIHLTGLVASPDGRQVVRVEGEGSDPHELGQRLAREAMAQGAGELLG